MSLKNLFQLLVLTLPLFAINIGYAGPNFGDSFEESDSDQILETDDSWSPNDNVDLNSSQSERRTETNYGVLVDIGEITPWNSFGLRYQSWNSPEIAWSIYAGVGKSQQRLPSQSLKINSESQNIGGRMQWWPSLLFPVSIAVDLGAHNWKIKTDCTIQESPAACQGGSINGFGISVASGIVITWFAEENIYLDWLMIGVKKSVFLNRSISKEMTSNAEEQSNRIVLDSKPFGFANIAIGWRY